MWKFRRAEKFLNHFNIQKELLHQKTRTWRAFRSVAKFFSEVLISDTPAIWTVISRVFSVGCST